MKHDADKVEPELVLRGFAHAIEAVAAVATYGAQKYAPDNWQHVADGERRYLNAMYRHLLAEHQGETIDPDSGLHHAAHAAWNALAHLELLLRRSLAKPPTAGRSAAAARGNRSNYPVRCNCLLGGRDEAPSLLPHRSFTGL